MIFLLYGLLSIYWAAALKYVAIEREIEEASDNVPLEDDTSTLSVMNIARKCVILFWVRQLL